VADRGYLPVPPERLRALLRVVAELHRGRRRDAGTVPFRWRDAAALSRLDEAFGGVRGGLRWEGDHRPRDHGDRLAAEPAPGVRPPPRLRATLRPYQRAGLEWLQRLRACGAGGVLADDMGLGKTLQTIAHIALEKAEGRSDRPSLVVAPTSLVSNWRREIGEFAPDLAVLVLHGPERHARFPSLHRADVVVTSYPLLVRDEERLAEHDYHLLVLDEAQTIKNHRNLAHRAARMIRARHRLCLTGTPVENHLGELWSLFDFLEPGMLGDPRTFRQWYRHPIETLGDEERLEALRGQLAPYVLRRLKDEVATELRPKTDLARPVELAGKQRDLYESIRLAAHDRVRRMIRERGLSGSTTSILDALTKLRQVCCDPRLVRMDAARFVKRSAKLESLMELLDAQLGRGHRVLLFSQFTTMLGLISEALGERGVRHLALTGATRHRQRVVDAFEGGEADIWLAEDADPLESPIEIHASPRGKKTQRIDLLSGGERALTALSLLFGIYLVKPSPFCVFDEVDAPLDENNIGRFIRLLQEFSTQTQFVVITHNPRTIEAADWIYGVTMEEPGVSTIVGVRLQEALQAAGAALLRAEPWPRGA